MVVSFAPVNLTVYSIQPGRCLEQDGGEIGVRGLAVVRGRLEARLDQLLEAHYRLSTNQRFANHLWRERNCLFTFLRPCVRRW